MLEPGHISRIRHDLRTPVNHILGYSEMLIEDAEDLGRGELIGDLKKINEAGHRLLGSITERVGKNKVVRSADLEDLLAEARVPIDHIMGYSQMLREQVAIQGDTQWESDLSKINRAAQTWFNLAEKALLPSDAIVSPHSLKGVFTQTTETGTEIDTSFIEEKLGGEEHWSGRVLIVDVDPNNRDILSRRLARYGHDIHTAATGEAALDLIPAGDFDLVLLDVMLPGKNGDEILTELKSDPEWQHLPVIMISASDKIDPVIRCLAAGAEDYLPKPCDPILLQVRIDAVLEKKRLRDQEKVILQELQGAQKKTDTLLLNILPAPIAERLKEGENPIVDELEEVTVLFADLAGFTSMFARLSASEIVAMLDEVFTRFDQLASKQRLEKIKTIGDAYLAVGGLPSPREDHAEAIADLALAMMADIDEMFARKQLPMQLRIGIDTGPVIAGVIGKQKFTYDLWGDTVNTASRMESSGEPGRIQVSERVHCRLPDGYSFEERGTIEVKGKGAMKTWWLEGRC
jgi:adenylate cyclase